MHCWKLVSILLFKLLVGTNGECFFTPLESSLLYYAKYPSRESILNSLSNSQENLKIIVLDTINDKLPAIDSIQWNNNDISSEDFQFYQDYADSEIQTVAFHLPPNGKLNPFKYRPLEEYHLLVLVKNVPIHALLHEIGHILIYNKSSRLLKSVSSEDLILAIRLYAEAFIDMTLVEHSDKFGFTEIETCSRHKYMKGNLATLRSILKYFKPQNEKQKQIHSQLYKLSSPIKIVDMQYHTTCFFY